MRGILHKLAVNATRAMSTRQDTRLPKMYMYIECQGGKAVHMHIHDVHVKLCDCDRYTRCTKEGGTVLYRY